MLILKRKLPTEIKHLSRLLILKKKPLMFHFFIVKGCPCLNSLLLSFNKYTPDITFTSN